MTDTSFALAILLIAAAGLTVVMASRLAERIRVPLPAILLLAAAIAANVISSMPVPSHLALSRTVTVALVAVLFSGGMDIGRARFRSSAGPILTVGVLGTFGTAGLAAVLLHFAFGFTWYVSLLVGTAVAPTDPTVVFSVLGRRQIEGRSGTILEGESGANDPVGIALMASLIGAHRLSGSGLEHLAWTFALQMAVGVVVGWAGGRALLWFMRRVPLPGEGLYPLRTLGAALLLYGAASVARGSGFLAVFVAGIVIGDERAPYKREIERFHRAIASLAEMIAFIILGITVNFHVIGQTRTWVPAVLLGLAVAVVVRPVVVELCLVTADLARNERRFVQFAGLKGAVPILLGSYLLAAGVSEPARLYGIVVVVVFISVVVQGGMVGTVARWLELPVVLVEPQPWAFGVRLREEPGNVHQIVVAAGSAADGATIKSLGDLPGDAWINLLVRNGRLLAVRGDTELQAGDELSVLADASDSRQLEKLFVDKAS
jgi:cell volume regulation protein A